VPPTGVPEALKECLGIIVNMTGNEVNVTADRFPQELDDSVLHHRPRQVLSGFSEVVDQLKDHAGLDLGFKVGQVR
jgi:hypothetical protein